jgi:nitrate/TMAO reductase-like tetraheme cytochrome c subunit
MASEGFNWKGLFINDETAQNTEKEVIKTPVQPISENKFPETTSFPTNPTAQIPNYSLGSNPFINEILEVYNKGFESLNTDGFDFFELYKSVLAVGVTNPQSYVMAFTMGKSLKTDLSKASLIEKSQYYIAEIEKVYNKYDATGNSKNKNLLAAINTQKSELSKNISDLETQIAKLQQELESKKAQFLKIDSENGQEFNEIQQKIEANNIAKQKILESINAVVTGINQYL